MSKSSKEGFIKLKFGPRWKYIACARSFIQNFLAISIEDKAKADKIAMAASELLENAVKYANSDTTNIFVNVDPQDEIIKVEVTNAATEEKIRELKDIYNKLKIGDPLDVYVSMMKAAAVRQDGKSQLGLARVQYETGGELKLNIDDDNNVTLAIDIK
jgi:hypothetical protein